MQERREKYKTEKINKMYEELLKVIEEEKKTDNTSGDNLTISKNKRIEQIESMLLALTAEIDGLEKREFDRNILPAKGILVKDDHVYLSVLAPSEKNYYMEVSKQCSMSLASFEKNKEWLWQTFMSPNSYVCSIYDAASDNYVGYCSIKDLNAKDWEIAIELLKEYRNQGYGSSALTLFTDRLTEITGNRFYKYLTDIDNVASQKLVKHIGGYPDGLTEFILRGEELEQFRAENIGLINENIVELAEEFASDPEELIGMVLQYRIDKKTETSKIKMYDMEHNFRTKCYQKN